MLENESRSLLFDLDQSKDTILSQGVAYVFIRAIISTKSAMM